VSVWNNRKYDPNVTEATTQAHKAKSGSGRFNKSLVNPDLLKPIARARQELETTHKFFTQPWQQGGGRILPSIKFLHYTGDMRKNKSRFDQEVLTFLAKYPAEVAAAQATLGDMYDPADYPDVQDMKAKFGVTIDVTPFPIDHQDWRTDMAQEAVDEAAAAMRETYERKESVMVRESYERARKVVQKMADVLSDPDKVFHDSLVGNVETLVDLLPSLNLTDDQNITDIVLMMQTDLCQSPQALRDDPVLRARTCAAANAILSRITQGLV
jgi:hypothetical protein